MPVPGDHRTYPLAAVMLLGALLGHAAVWAAVVNRFHAMGWSRRWCHRMTAVMFLACVAIPTVWIAWAVVRRPGWQTAAWAFPNPPAAAYVGLCWLMAVVAAAGWLGRRLGASRVGVLLEQRREAIVVPAAVPTLDDPPPATLASLPGDRPAAAGHEPMPSILGRLASGLLRHAWASLPPLEFVQRTIRVPRLPAELDGLRLVHLTDLHLTGYVGKPYFQEVVRRTNQCEADLVAITGDLIDSPACFGWLAEIFGQLRSRYGVYFILGNHDEDFGAQLVRPVLTNCGLIDLGGRWVTANVRETPVVLAGNEWPWLPPMADLSAAPPDRSAGGPLRIVLAHSPDQFGWACRNGADLVLSGHLHGGQVRLPIVGPLLSPSLWGVYYADRPLYRRGPTVMHVSPGISGQVPLRYGCPPELVELRLRSGGQWPVVSGQKKAN